MPLDEKELLITLINKQDEKNRPPSNDDGFLKFAIKIIIFIALFGMLGVTIGPIFGTILWVIILIIYAAISFSGSSSKNTRYSPPKNIKKDEKINYNNNEDEDLPWGLKRCPKCNTALKKKIKICPSCNYKF